jgi:DNA-binding PadR family transcriptional regulator
MSALTTRMLVLGAVRIFGPANGYQLRRELLSWEVERWAHIKPGSIYSMLSTLESQGAVERHDLPDPGGRPVAVYLITDAGDAELRRMLLDSIESVEDAGDLLPIRVAINFATLFTREEFLGAVRARIALFVEGEQELAQKIVQLAALDTIPPLVVSELELELAVIRAQRDWLLEFEKDLVAGGVPGFVGEHAYWHPPQDDPGWRMASEREQYLARIAEARGQA